MKAALAALSLLLLAAACSSPISTLPPAPSQAFRQAEDAFARKDYDNAAVRFRSYLNGAPETAYVPRAYYELALAQYHMQDYTGSLTTLNELGKQFPERRWVQTLALRGDAERALGNRVSALLAWEDAWLVAKTYDQPRLRARLAGTAKQLTEDERAEASDILVVPAVREIVGIGELPALAEPPKVAAPSGEADEGEAVAAMEPVGEAVEAPPEVLAAPATDAGGEIDTSAVAGAPVAEPRNSGEAGFESEVIAAVPEEAAPVSGPEGGSEVRVGSLLPLTGADRENGHRALAGLRLAFADSPGQLVVRDTGGDPVVTVDLLAQLRDDPEIVAVIGPLRSNEAAAAAPAAERAQVPLLLLSQIEGLAGRFVMQAAMTRRQQTELLVSWAADHLKLHQFGVVHPNDGYGTAFAEVFKQVVKNHGASVIGTVAYPSGAPDLHALAAAVRHWQSSGLQAVFVPDAAATASRVAVEVRNVQFDIVLLGTESWNDPTALANAGSSINGAIFADSFFAESPRPSTREFVERFERGAGHPPTVFEAQAYDAGVAVRRAFAGGAATRQQVVSALQGLGSVEGAGELRASPSGFQRGLSLLYYHDGKVEELPPKSAPQTGNS